MIRKVLAGVIGATLGLSLLTGTIIYTKSGQDFMLQRMATVAMSSASYDSSLDAIQVYMCGTSSPLPDTSRAQACVAVVTPENFFIVDSGAGSTTNVTLGRLPMDRLDGVLISHFHSDHIAELYELNLNSWVAGKADSLEIYGPKGIDDVIDGINATYQLDRRYRVAHHGADFLPPENGILRARQIDQGEIFHSDNLRITAFSTSHPPIAPSLGYKFEYKDRVVVITGDTLISSDVLFNSQDADLLLSDAASLVILDTLADAADANGRPRNGKILRDVKDYHASTESLITLAAQTSIHTIGLYHLVPPPQNTVMQNIYHRDLPSNVMLTRDRMWFILEANKDTVVLD